MDTLEATDVAYEANTFPRLNLKDFILTRTICNGRALWTKAVMRT